MDQIEMQVRKEEEMCYEAPFYTLGPLGHRYCRGLRPHTSAIGAAIDRLVRRVHAVLLTPKSTWACRTAKT